MPNKVVTVRRWEVVGSFIVIVLISIALAWWSDYRDDQLERRVQRNVVTNKQQDAVRRELLAELRKADARACGQIEALKEQFREQAIQNYQRLEQNARLLEIRLTPALRREALAARNRTLARFRAGEC